MVALNFNKRFADAVERGEKCQTVRREWANGKFPFYPGVKLQLYTGQRTRHSRKLGEAVCTRTTAISIDRDWRVLLGGRYLDSEEVDAFAQRDGFADAREMCGFFEGSTGLPLDGWVIEWERP